MKTDDEVWKDIEFTNSEYQVSNFGRIRSYVRTGARSSNRISKKYKIRLTPPNGGGYPSVCINHVELGVKINIRIHRLVAKLFVANPHNYPIVMHIDDDKKNCHFTNLKWGTSADNNRDAFLKGIIIPAKGEARAKSKLTEKDVIDIFTSQMGCRELGRKYKIYHSAISAIKTGKSWNHVTGLPCTRKKRAKYSKDIKYE